MPSWDFGALQSDLYSQLHGDPVEGTGQLVAPRPGRAPQRSSDFLPTEALAAQLNQPALFFAQALPTLR